MPTIYVKEFKGKVPVSPDNLAYQAERNALIPYAVAHADRVAGPKPKHLDSHKAKVLWGEVWNQTYFKEMDRLWERKGE